MRVAGINFDSIVDGEGVRVVVFVSGCHHNCKGCHNPSSHSFTAGQPFTEALQQKIIDYIKTTPFVCGLTLSGGDPMYSAEELIPFIEMFKKELPNASIWVYSGFLYEEILANQKMRSLLKLCDILVDGEFILEQRDITLAYKGSRNQRIIEIQASLAEGKPILYGVRNV